MFCRSDGAARQNCCILYSQDFTGSQSIIGGSCYKYLFLSRQTRVCSDKVRLLSRQKYGCPDKYICVAKNTCLSRQIYACRDKTFVATNTCLSRQIFLAANARGKRFMFVTTSILLSRQKTCLLRQNVCRDKNGTCGGSHHHYVYDPDLLLR